MINPFVKINSSDKDVLYVRHQAMVDAGISHKYLTTIKSGTKWKIDDPGDARMKLYDFEAMPLKYREDVKSWLKKETGGAFDNPYEYMALQPIRQCIVVDDKAEDFFIKFKYELNGEPTSLKPEQVENCTRNANLLNMLLHFKGQKRDCKKKFGIDWLPFVEQVIRVIQSDVYKLPKTYRGLILETLNKYESFGYEALLPPRLGNQNTAKVKDGDLSKDMMIELFSHPNQYDDAYIQRAFNAWARSQGLPTITRATVKNKRKEYGFLFTAEREGWQDHNKTYSRSVHRTHPTQPTYLWEGDDNHIDWWFVDNKNNIKRIKAYVVTDSYKGINYPLGWAFTENDITEETIRVAFLMAMHHIKDLTGSWYLPHEIKTDRWGLKSLQPFYESMGHYYPTPVGSKNRGWLENFFGHPDWKRSLKTDTYGLPATNYTGHNISSKTMGVNQEALQAAFKNKQLPHIDDAGKWITEHFHRLRTIPIGYEESAQSRQEIWLEGWASMPEAKKRNITDEQFLLKCGMRHNANGGNQITKAGVQPTISGKQYTYAVPPAFFLPNIGRKVETIYTPFDMSKVIITDNERLRFTAQHITPVAGCMADMEQGGRSFLNQIISEKKADVDRITTAKKDRRNRLQAAGMDSESVLKLGAYAQKELKTAAIEDYEDVETIPALPEPVYHDHEADEDDFEENAAMAI